MQRKKILAMGLAAAAFSLAFSFLTAMAAPVITITKGNPSTKVNPPYQFTFEVSDPAGIISIVVNGRELKPGGADFYDVDWTTYYNQSFTIVATNVNNESTTQNLEITNIQMAQEQTQAAPPPQTAPPVTAPPETAPPQTAPMQTAPPATTRAETTAPPRTTAARTTARTTEAPEETTEPETTTPETAAEETMESSTELESTEPETAEVATETEAPETTMEETEPETTEPETIPPDSYRLYPGGRKNMTVPVILLTACLCVIAYCLITIVLNRKRLKAYKNLYDVLIKRKKVKEQREKEELSEMESEIEEQDTKENADGENNRKD